jgi:hypothetical protein
MASAPAFPPELWQQIAISVSEERASADLLSLALTCRLIYGETIRLLYTSVDADTVWSFERYINLYPNYWEHSDVPRYTNWLADKSVIFLKKMIDGDWHGSCVRELVFTKDRSIVEGFWFLFAEALAKMPNLKVLQLNSGLPAPKSLFEKLAECSFRLKKLAWFCDTETENLIPFLREQNAIQTFLYRSPMKDRTIPSLGNVLPNLVEIGDSPGMCYAFLPGRSIKSVQLRTPSSSWPGHLHLDLAVSKCGANVLDAFNKVESLDLSRCCYPQAFLEMFAEHLKALRYLHYHFLTVSTEISILVRC